MQKGGISPINDNGGDEISDNSETFYIPRVVNEDQGNSDRSEVEVVETKKKNLLEKLLWLKDSKPIFLIAQKCIVNPLLLLKLMERFQQ